MKWFVLYHGETYYIQAENRESAPGGFLEIEHPPVEWLTKQLKDNAEKIKKLLEENEIYSSELTKIYSKE